MQKELEIIEIYISLLKIVCVVTAKKLNLIETGSFQRLR